MQPSMDVFADVLLDIKGEEKQEHNKRQIKVKDLADSGV